MLKVRSRSEKNAKWIRRGEKRAEVKQFTLRGDVSVKQYETTSTEIQGHRAVNQGKMHLAG